MSNLDKVYERLEGAVALKLGDFIYMGWSFEPEQYDDVEDTPVFEIFADGDFSNDDITFDHHHIDNCKFNGDGSITAESSHGLCDIQPLIVKPL